MPPHFFESLSSRQLARLFPPLLAAALLLTILLNAVGRPLTTPQAPAGIVSFELAGSLERAQAVLASWDAPARERAAFSLGLDYLYMLAYPAAISLACVWAERRLQRARSWLWRAGRSLAWGQWLAGLLDGVENLALVLLLFGSRSALWPPLAAVCAAVKFALVLSGLGYALVGLVAGRREMERKLGIRN